MLNLPSKQLATVHGESIEHVCAGTGPASVVLVNGAGGPIEGWFKVFGPLTEFSKAFAYNRPGVGGSTEPSVPQCGSHMVGSLRSLLRVAGVTPPYVLVGHSLGGLIVNLYARRHPSEVGAVVLLEATSPSDPADLAKHENRIQRSIRRAIEWISPSNPNAETRHVPTTVSELRAAPAFPAVPLFVITGGKSAMAWATSPKALAARAKNQQALTSLPPGSRHVIAHRSGHFPQFTESDVVVATVRAAVDAFGEKSL